MVGVAAQAVETAIAIALRRVVGAAMGLPVMAAEVLEWKCFASTPLAWTPPLMAAEVEWPLAQKLERNAQCFRAQRRPRHPKSFALTPSTRTPPLYVGVSAIHPRGCQHTLPVRPRAECQSRPCPCTLSTRTAQRRTHERACWVGRSSIASSTCILAWAVLMPSTAMMALLPLPSSRQPNKATGGRHTAWSDLHGQKQSPPMICEKKGTACSLYDSYTSTVYNVSRLGFLARSMPTAVAHVLSFYTGIPRGTELKFMTDTSAPTHYFPCSHELEFGRTMTVDPTPKFTVPNSRSPGHWCWSL